MERIRLTKDEKRVLRWVALKRSGRPEGMSNDGYFEAVIGLTEKKLLVSATNYDDVLDVDTTAKGRVYCSQNPHLYNPVDWKWLATFITALITAIATTLALFMACSKL